MKKLSLLTALLCGIGMTEAATHAVLPGASIQAKINLAVAGDIVAIFGGTYNEDLTINKAIRLVEVSGQQVILTGSVTFTGVTNCPVFDGFTVGSSGRGITVTNTTGLVFRNLDARSGSGITTSGTTNLKISDSQLSSVTAGGSTVEISKTSLTGGINQTGGNLFTASVTVSGNFDTQTAALKTVAFRTTVAGDNTWRSKKNWFGYSTARSFNCFDANNAKIVIVGCLVNRMNQEANGISAYVTNSQIQILNNKITGVRYSGSYDQQKNGMDLRGGGNKAFVANNYCSLAYAGTGIGNSVRGAGIYVRDFTDAVMINNIVVGAKYGIAAPFGAIAKNNMYSTQWGELESDGIIAEGTIHADPLFVENEAPKLQPQSPCINAGTSDPRYNDRDGSRNDIGPSGGPWIDPDGWTTENPVVISFDLSPDMVLEGVDTEVILSEGQAVSAP